MNMRAQALIFAGAMLAIVLILAGHSHTTYQNQVWLAEQQEHIERAQDFLFLRQEVIGARQELILEYLREQHQNNYMRITHTNRTIDHSPVDRFCLAKNIYHEARGEDLLGQYAVAQVTINRVKHSRWPNDVCHVVMQPWQFSWANDRTQRWTHPVGRDWEAAKRIAADVLDHGARVAGLESALFYHADWVSPSWRKPRYKIAQIGAHIFYSSDRKI